MSQKYLYSFEAKEIQKFILHSDKLKEMVGGSEIVALLCDQFLIKSLETLGGSHEIIANAAGWGRIIFYDIDVANNFFAHWPLLAAQFAPGLQVIQAMIALPNESSLPDAVDKINLQLRRERNLVMHSIPEITPLIERNPRTGSAAVVRDKDHGLLDRQSVRKRAYKGSTLTISRQLKIDSLQWPEEFEHIVDDDNHYLAIVHADGNDLGSTLIRIKEHVKENYEKAKSIYKNFSKVITESTIGAAQHAFDTVLKPAAKQRAGKMQHVIPGRPIVLGGDDLTIIVRADLAFDFTEQFLREFENLSGQKLNELLGGMGLPRKLTACAGIAFVKKNYPFVYGYELAESICGYTKQEAKQNKSTIDEDMSGTEYIPSSFAFHKNTSSIAGDYAEVCHNELTSRDEKIKLWSGPYGVFENCGQLIPYNRLKKLSNALCNLPGGSVRDMIADLYIDENLANKRFERIMQVADKDAKDQITEALVSIGIKGGVMDGNKHTPLFDAHTMNSLTEK
jgi:RNA polymerase-binding transcription factor DksA